MSKNKKTCRNRHTHLYLGLKCGQRLKKHKGNIYFNHSPCQNRRGLTFWLQRAERQMENFEVSVRLFVLSKQPKKRPGCVVQPGEAKKYESLFCIK